MRLLSISTEYREKVKAISLDELLEHSIGRETSEADFIDATYEQTKEDLIEGVEKNELHPLEVIREISAMEREMGKKLGAYVSLKRLLTVLAETDSVADGLGVEKGAILVTPRTPEEKSRRAYQFLRARLSSVGGETRRSLVDGFLEETGIRIVPYNLVAGDTILAREAEITWKDVKKLLGFGTDKVLFAHTEEAIGDVGRHSDDERWVVMRKGILGRTEDKCYVGVRGSGERMKTATGSFGSTFPKGLISAKFQDTRVSGYSDGVMTDREPC